MSVTSTSSVGRVVASIDRDALVDEIIDGHVRRLPSWSALTPEVLAGAVRDGVRANVDLMLALLAGDEDVIRECGQEARTALGERMALGITPEDSIAAVRLAGERIWRALLAAARPEELALLARAAGRLMRYLAVLADTAGRYVVEQDRSLDRVDRMSRALLDALVAGDPYDAATARLSRAIGFPLEERYQALVAVGVEGQAPAPSQVAAELRRRGVLAVAGDHDVVGLVAASAPRRASPDGVAIGLSDPAGVHDLHAALAQARELAEAARSASRTGVVEPGELVGERLLAANPGMSGNIERWVLAPLRAHAQADLLGTLAAHVDADLDRRATATALHLHPSSVRYRLERITALTGLRLDRADDIAVLTLAVKLWRARR